MTPSARRPPADGGPGRHARFDGLPVDVGEDRVDVLRPLGRLVVEQVRVLPHVDHEERDEAGYVPHFVERDPMHVRPMDPNFIEEEERSMNKDILKGQWTQLKGRMWCCERRSQPSATGSRDLRPGAPDLLDVLSATARRPSPT